MVNERPETLSMRAFNKLTADQRATYEEARIEHLSQGSTIRTETIKRLLNETALLVGSDSGSVPVYDLSSGIVLALKPSTQLRFGSVMRLCVPRLVLIPRRGPCSFD